MFQAPGQTTTEVPKQHAFDVSSLQKYLSQVVPSLIGVDTALEVKKFGYGQSNPTYHVKCSNGTQLVLRKRPAGKLVASAHRVDREFRVMKAVVGKGFPVPRVLHLCEDSSVIGAAFYIMTFVPGQIASNNLLNVPKNQREATMMSFVATLAHLHTIDPKEVGLVGSPNAQDYAPIGGFYSRQLKTMERVSKQQEKVSSEVPRIPNLDLLLELFNKHLPHDDATVCTIVHGDFKPDNVILSATEPANVIAVVDWELSTLGHPLSDVANLCLPFHTHGFDFMPGFDDSVTEAGVLQHYCSLVGRPYPIHKWGFFIAYACFRLSVICQGVAARSVLGQASDTQAKGSAFSKAVNYFASKALQQLQDCDNHSNL